jgi:phosphoenolpyruvate synthase/pyruvate phosphate dikinase
LFDEYSKIYIKLVAYFRSSRPEFSDHFIVLLKKELTKLNLSKFKLEKTIYYLITSFGDNPINSEQKDWYLLLKDKNCEKGNFLQHIRKYPWLFTNTYSEKESLNFLNLKYNFDKKKLEKIKNNLKEFEKQKKEAIKYRNNLFKSEKLDYLKKVSLIIQKQSIERLLIKTSLMGINYVAKDLLKSISCLAGLNVNQFTESYTSEDIKNLLLKNKKLSMAEVKNRRTKYIFLVKDLKKIFLSGHDATSIINEFVKNNLRDDIKGSIAYKGCVRGRVQIINIKNIKMLSESMTKFKKGDILVTSMTQPNIVSIINKAAAIVTDQGGIISHAAIISREMKKPCIVGTKVATQVLRTGEMVEVDANNGIVRILNK